MEKNEYWICPWCKSYIDVNTKKCWRCDFVSDNVTKYKYNPNKKYFDLIAVIIAIIASFCLIIAINNKEKERKRQHIERVELEKQEFEQHLRNVHIREEERRREYEKERFQSKQQRFESKQNNALQRISNLESQYYNLLRQYGSVIGTNGEVQVMEQLLSTLKEINRIAEKEGVYQKRINNIQGKIKSDLLQRYGRKINGIYL